MVTVNDVATVVAGAGETDMVTVLKSSSPEAEPISSTSDRRPPPVRSGVAIYVWCDPETSPLPHRRSAIQHHHLAHFTSANHAARPMTLGPCTTIGLDGKRRGATLSVVHRGIGCCLRDNWPPITGDASTPFPVGALVLRRMLHLNRDLGGNSLGAVPGRAFQGLDVLRDLDLGDANITSLETGTFQDLSRVTQLNLGGNSLGAVPGGAFIGLFGLLSLDLGNAGITSLETGAFQGLLSVLVLDLGGNSLGAIPGGAFEGLNGLRDLDLGNVGITSLETGAFHGLSLVTQLNLGGNSLGAVPRSAFFGLDFVFYLDLGNAGITSLETGAFQDLLSVLVLNLGGNSLGAIPGGAFEGLNGLRDLYLDGAGITSIATGAFDAFQALFLIHLQGNPDLQCIPGYQLRTEHLAVMVDDSFDVSGQCGCDVNDESSCEANTECCPEELVCRDSGTFAADACGDPHMTGFHGQKFDFTGEDGAWYCLLSDPGAIHLNIRVTAPVPDRPDITYITGLSVLTTDVTGVEHSVVITVKDPHCLQSACPTSSDGSAYRCIADGALRVVLDGQEGRLLQPGTAVLGPETTVDAVNLPGACRSFGFEHYWERKKLEYLQVGRKLSGSQSMGEWILSDPTATNMDECEEYVARAVANDSSLNIFDMQSEHASFRIITPKATIRLSHGRLHQKATVNLGLPDHLTWQMNVAIDQNDVSFRAKGVLGETVVPRRDAAGDVVMKGMGAIRGEENEYRVTGPLEVHFQQEVDHQQ